VFPAFQTALFQDVPILRYRLALILDPECMEQAFNGSQSPLSVINGERLFMGNTVTDFLCPPNPVQFPAAISFEGRTPNFVPSTDHSFQKEGDIVR
jgi:hypothetical protein